MPYLYIFLAQNAQSENKERTQPYSHRRENLILGYVNVILTLHEAQIKLLLHPYIKIGP
jgi:hypothetical protein